MKLIAVNRASAQPSLSEGVDDEIASTADLSNDEEKEIDKLEIDALSMDDGECTSAQAVVNAAQEWNTQRGKIGEARVIDFSGIQRKEDVNEVSKLIEATAMKRAHAHRRLLRRVKTDLEGLRKQEKVVTDAKALVKRYKKLLRQSDSSRVV
ncbi:hypothetical protein BJV74DRAFT_883222 [Russula compacta]|nr:hypothetical protein BJV74DRAFT_883222 [Russula compacta]